MQVLIIMFGPLNICVERAIKTVTWEHKNIPLDTTCYNPLNRNKNNKENKNFAEDLAEVE
jgi:hypothetical protein